MSETDLQKRRYFWPKHLVEILLFIFSHQDKSVYVIALSLPLKEPGRGGYSRLPFVCPITESHKHSRTENSSEYYAEV